MQVRIYAFDEPLGTPVRIEAMADVQLEFAELTEPMAVGSLVEVQVDTLFSSITEVCICLS